jgi:hypothetical protein
MFEHCNLDIVWNLVIGYCLEFGYWNLEFTSSGLFHTIKYAIIL